MEQNKINAAPPSIIEHTSIGLFLTDYVNFHRKMDRAYSLRALARKLKPTSPSLVTMIARGERTPSDQFISNLASGLKFSASEKSYAHHLGSFERAKDQETKLFHYKEMMRISPRHSTLNVDQSRENLFSNWYYSVIGEMVRMSGFENNPEKIASLLGANFDSEKIVNAIEFLKKINVLQVGSDGQLIRTTDFVRGIANLPSQVYRQFHKQVIQRGFTAIDNKPIGERFMSSTVMAIPADKYERATKLITSFRDAFMQEISSNESKKEDVFYLTIQFFNALDKPRGQPAFDLN